MDIRFMKWYCERRKLPRGLEIKCGTAIYKGKGDPMESGSYRGIKLLEHAMKVVERIFEYRIRQQTEIDDMQFGDAFCIAVQNFVEIGCTFAEISVFSHFFLVKRENSLDART